jgi:DNA polymerase-3 subunit gamma/tau
MSQFVVSARKYRPTSFDEVMGQDHVAKTLKNALLTDHLAHAFLFTGPRGVGKTTCARILAKIINCQNPVNKVEACNQCTSCLSFNDNASFNIFELDAASNNSVENIRSLIDQVRIQPQQGRYKVFIIDEVHMLSAAAFNAFLKTLEEPPAHAVFILATTEKHKIIPTILSRCQIFDFRRIQISDAVKQLKKICQEENIDAEEEALHTIALKADGAMRDALTIFDKIKSSISGSTITYKDVITNLNLLDYEYYFKMTDAIVRQNIGQVLLILDEVLKEGFDAEHFILGLAEHFRDLLIAHIPATLKILEGSDELKKRYHHQASLIDKGFLLTGLNILNQTDIHLARAKNKRLQVELALSKITYIRNAREENVFESHDDMPDKKKTDDVGRVTASPAIAPADSFNKQTVSDSPQGSQTEQYKQETPVSSVSEKTPNEETQATHSSVSSSSNPLLKLTDISAIRAQILEAEKTRQISKENITTDTVMNIWMDFCENNPSKSVQTALKAAILDFRDLTVYVKVPAQVTKDIILHETALIERLRDELGVPDIKMDIDVDKSAFPDYEEVKPAQLLTQREKYVQMLEKNRALGLLTQKLALKLDSEI